MQIVLLRHGETDSEAEHRVLGWIDKSLNKQGILATEQYAAFLQRQGEHFDLVLTSPLTRARQTALIIAQTLNNQILENELIKERNFGELNGLTWEEFTQKFPDLAKINQPNYQENLPHGESIPQVVERVHRFVHFLQQLKLGNKYRRILVVTHTGIIRLLLRQLMSYTPEQTRELHITNLTAFSLEI